MLKQLKKVLIENFQEEKEAKIKHEEAKNLKYEYTEENEAETIETAEEVPQRKLSRRERREMERKNN